MAKFEIEAKIQITTSDYKYASDAIYTALSTNSALKLQEISIEKVSVEYGEDA